ncbi:HAMP domain protein [Enterococcus faecalis 13-SD-W-01]|nr:HAMP domain protein [Enterococcus faecalis 13-SD-W-01]
MNRLRWFKKNQLFCLLVGLVVSSIVITAWATAYLVVGRSQETHLQANRQANQILLEKIQQEYEQLNTAINRVFEVVETSQAAKKYLQNPLSNGQTIIEMKKQLNTTRAAFESVPSNLILLGKNGNSFFQNDAVRSSAVEKFWESEMFDKINRTSAKTQFFYRTEGLTTATKETPGLLFVRKLLEGEDIYGYALVFISESDFRAIYQELLDTTLHTIYILDEDQQIISSQNQEKLGEKIDRAEIERDGYRINQRNLYSYNFVLYDIFNEEQFMLNMRIVEPTLLILSIITLFVAGTSFLIIRKMTQPIYQLIAALPAIKHGDFTKQVKVQGTTEVRELSLAYNQMLKDLTVHIEKIYQSESEKRLAEIQTLQMQIQPHFVYNTLTTIKFLIWQCKNKEASEALEHFIQLLRYTLSRKEEKVYLREELEIIREYVEILQLRYGRSIQLEIEATQESKESYVPKMLLQPLIENIYLHAFPEGQAGYAQIFARTNESQLIIEIIDNGVGFDMRGMGKIEKANHYTGIGLQNIKERLKLLYEEESCFLIQTEKDKGTVITIMLPKIKKKEN